MNSIRECYTALLHVVTMFTHYVTFYTLPIWPLYHIRIPSVAFVPVGYGAQQKRNVDINVIKCFDIKKFQGYNSRGKGYKLFVTLFKAFKRQRGLLRSDGNVRQTGGLDTRSGSLLISNEVLKVPKDREDTCPNAEQARIMRLSALEQRRTALEEVERQKALEKDAKKHSKIALAA